MSTNRVICLVLAIAAVASSIASSATYNREEEAKLQAYYVEQEEIKARGEITFSGPYCVPDRHPQFLILLTTLLITGSFILVIAKNLLWSLPAFLSALLMFPYWLWDTRWAISMAENVAVEGLDLVLFRANAFDLFTLAFLSLVVVYQSSLVIKAVRSALTPYKLP